MASLVGVWREVYTLKKEADRTQLPKMVGAIIQPAIMSFPVNRREIMPVNRVKFLKSRQMAERTAHLAMRLSSTAIRELTDAELTSVAGGMGEVVQLRG